jgi:hypothetical protein
MHLCGGRDKQYHEGEDHERREGRRDALHNCAMARDHSTPGGTSTENNQCHAVHVIDTKHAPARPRRFSAITTPIRHALIENVTHGEISAPVRSTQNSAM